MSRTRELSILGYNREIDRCEARIDTLRAALEDAMLCLQEHDPEVEAIAMAALQEDV